MFSSNSSTASASSKRYGRGGTTVNDVFSRTPTSDPFLFDDDSETINSNSKRSSGTGSAATKHSTKSKSKKVSSAGSSIDSRIQKISNSRLNEGSRGINESTQSSRRKHNTRTHGGGLSTDKSADSRTAASASNNHTRQAERPAESDRLRRFLQGDAVPQSSSSSQVDRGGGRRATRSLRSNSSHSANSANSSRDSSPDQPVSDRAESDRMKQFLQSASDNTTIESTASKKIPRRTLRSNTSSANSSRDSSPTKQGYSRGNSMRSRGGSTSSVTSTEGAEVVSAHQAAVSDSEHTDDTELDLTMKMEESDKMKAFLYSGAGDSEGDETPTNSQSKSSTSRRYTSTSSKTASTKSASSKSNTVSSRVSNSQSVESDRLKAFLSGDKTSGRSTCQSAARKESRRMRAFLGETVSSEEEEVEGEPISRKSGLSQDMLDVDLNSSHSSPLKRRYDDEFDFGSESETESDRPVPKPVAKSSRTATAAATSSSLSSGNFTPTTASKSRCVEASSIAQSLSSTAKKSGVSLKASSQTVIETKTHKGEQSVRLSNNIKTSLTHHKPGTSFHAHHKPDKSKGDSEEKPASINQKTAAAAVEVKPVINFEKMEGRGKEKTTAKPIRKLLQSPAKQSSGKYRYNHRAWLEEGDDEEAPPTQSANESGAHRLKRPLELKKVTVYPDKIGDSISTQVKVRQDQKRLYTVVRNVRQAHECQDHGENQQIDDDLEFLLDGLKPREATSSRYLSAVSLAKKCTNPTFRMYLRSQGSLTQIFTSMKDACSDPRLALSATAIMFMLCQDRLNMDLDRSSLQLIVELLEYDDKAQLDNTKELEDYRKSVNTVYDLYKSAIPAGEELIDKSDLSPGYLAMECLLILTSRRSGDWFKEELREVGALIYLSDNIIDKTCVLMKCDYDMELSPAVLIIMKKICRGLRVLEHVTACNGANQNLIISHQGGEFVLSLCRLVMFGVEALPTHYISDSNNTSTATSPGHLILQLLLGVLRVLVNVTHDSISGCQSVSSFQGIIEILLKCILQTPQYVIEEQRFDLLVLGVGLSINMCEHSALCRQTLLDTETLSSYDSICESESMTADEALLQLFHQRLRAAEKVECETGTLQESDVTQAITDDANETLTEVLHKAGRHMEDTIVASYIALLIGVIVQHSPDYTDQIKLHLTDKSFSQLVSVLQKFLDFMKMADAASGNSGSKSIATVISYLREYT